MKEKLVHSAPRVLIAAFVFALIAVFAPTTTHAQGPYGNMGGFMYNVQYGDSMNSIAGRFGVPMQSLMQANPQYGSNMYVGQLMYVPMRYSPNGYSSTRTYTVQAGDTLYGIAQRYGVPMYTLMGMNRLYNPNYLPIGYRLRMPYSRFPRSSYRTYIIRFGDTLSGIALRFGTSVYALMIANNIPNPNLIFAGMRLVVPTPLTYSTARAYLAPQSSPQNPSSAYPTQTPTHALPRVPSPTLIPAPVVTTSTPVPPTLPPVLTPTSVPPSPTPVLNMTVSMKNLAFSPGTITVHVGTHVRWTNTESGGIPHTVTSGAPNVPNGLFDSGTLNPGQSFQFTFTSTGTFAYYCRIHGAMMTGTVVVTP